MTDISIHIWEGDTVAVRAMESYLGDDDRASISIDHGGDGISVFATRSQLRSIAAGIIAALDKIEPEPASLRPAGGGA